MKNLWLILAALLVFMATDTRQYPFCRRLSCYTFISTREQDQPDRPSHTLNHNESFLFLSPHEQDQADRPSHTFIHSEPSLSLSPHEQDQPDRPSHTFIHSEPQDKPSWRPGRYNFIENVPRLPENLPGLTVSDSIMQKLFPDKFSAELSVGDTPVYSKSGFESGHQHQEESWKDDPGSRSPLHS